jgi:hypothetical protein
MSPLLKSFLEGLLNKAPNERYKIIIFLRLSWPDLLTHPFIAETN